MSRTTPFQENLLQGRTVLITGGSSGLGFAMARRCGELGAQVAICGRNEEKLSRARQELEERGIPVFTFSLDVREESQVARMLEATIAHFGNVTDLINNAAGNFLSFSEDLTPNGFRAVVEIVLFGTFYFSLHFGRYLIRERRRGTILNIVTTYAETGSAYVLPSACAKAGVLAMTRSLAYEWGRYGIRVNAIAPGIVPTRGAFERLIPDDRAVEAIQKSIPLGRLGRPEEIADLAVFLLSDAAEYIQGECITMDGGERLIAGQFSRLDQLFGREELKRFFSALKQKSSPRKEP